MVENVKTLELKTTLREIWATPYFDNNILTTTVSTGNPELMR